MPFNTYDWFGGICIEYYLEKVICQDKSGKQRSQEILSAWKARDIKRDQGKTEGNFRVNVQSILYPVIYFRLCGPGMCLEGQS